MRLIKIARLEALIRDVFKEVHLSPQQIRWASKVMGYADVHGIDSHGIILLKTYVDRIRAGVINRDPRYFWEKRGGPVSILHGDRGMGHFLGAIAMEKAIELAKQNTIGLVFVRGATHYGASGYYTQMAGQKGLIGFTTTNTMPLMAPTGGAERVLGNNPISFAIPRLNNNPIVLDMATSTVAAGRLILAHQKGEEIPKEWALDKDGFPTSDPYAGFKGGGSLLPLGHHKGFGLALVMDVLAGVLSGASFGKDTKHSNLGFVMGAFNYKDVMDESEFFNRLEQLVSMIQTCKPAQVGGEGINLPGEREFQVQRDRMKTGIPLHAELVSELKQLLAAEKLDLADYLSE